MSFGPDVARPQAGAVDDHWLRQLQHRGFAHEFSFHKFDVAERAQAVVQAREKKRGLDQ
jgi:hypothetical protein